MAVERRQLMMGGAAGVALILALWSMWPATPAPSAGAQAAAPARGRTAGAAELAPTAPVKLDALTSSREGPGEGARNPFRFEARVAPAPSRPIITEQPVIETPRAPLPPPGPPPVPPIPLKFTGLVERANGVKWAVLTDGKSVMYGKDGDIIDGRYTIVKIGTESIEMTYVDGRGRQVIRLTGQ
jgi:hypothetical protein